jgi:excinuclease ABC subunit C
MVFFEDGSPNKEGYRHFKIRTVEGADDYGMMYEVLLRRYKRAVEKDDLPDLVLLDGGRGQLNVAQEVFKELQVKEIDLISLAKERIVAGTRAARYGKAEEKIFHPQYREPLQLEKQSPLLHLLDRIRDEAHRFAITYHKKMRSKETIKSVIGNIGGIGKVRERELLRHFGSVEAIKKASIDDLTKAPRMDERLAQKVYAFFREDDK